MTCTFYDPGKKVVVHFHMELIEHRETIVLHQEDVKRLFITLSAV